MAVLVPTTTALALTFSAAALVAEQAPTAVPAAIVVVVVVWAAELAGAEMGPGCPRQKARRPAQTRLHLVSKWIPPEVYS